MVSHNKNSPNYDPNHDYSGYYDRLQQEIDVDDIDLRELRRGFKNLPSIKAYLQELRDIRKILNESGNIQQLNALKDRINKLPNWFSNETRLELLERITNLSISKYNEFARSKGITLNDQVKANEERWGKKQVIVIRKRGRFIAWKKI